MPAHPGGTRKIWTVSELNRAAGELLEEAFPRVWVEGEISNWKVYGSGHAYFSLKDDGGQIAAVLFRAAAKNFRFEPRDGLAALAAGRVSLYGQRGQYQLIVDELEPRGKGALQLAFEQLKEKLQKEGLFDAARKRPLPALPRTVGVVTSPTGAVIRDIITVLGRRFAGVRVLLNPVRVQGEGAGAEIAAAITSLPGGAMSTCSSSGAAAVRWRTSGLSTRRWSRGRSPHPPSRSSRRWGTRRTSRSRISSPTCARRRRRPPRNWSSRARTPSRPGITTLGRQMRAAFGARLQRARHRLDSLAVHRMISDGRRRLRDLAQEVDGLEGALQRAGAEKGAARRRSLERLGAALAHLSPRARWAVLGGRLVNAGARLEAAQGRSIATRRNRVAVLAGTLDALSPLGVLGRGYSICRRLPGLRDRQGCRHGAGGRRDRGPAAPGPLVVYREGSIVRALEVGVLADHAPGAVKYQQAGGTKTWRKGRHRSAPRRRHSRRRSRGWKRSCANSRRPTCPSSARSPSSRRGCGFRACSTSGSTRRSARSRS